MTEMGSLPQYELTDQYTTPVGDSGREVVVYELRCPRKKCRGYITVPRRDLKASAFQARPCFHCFRTALLPEKLIAYVRKFGRKAPVV